MNALFSVMAGSIAERTNIGFNLSVQPHGVEVYEIKHSLTSASRGSYTIWLQVGRYPYVLDPATKVEWVRGGYSGTDFIMAPVEL